MSSNKGDINATILNGFLKGDSAYAIAKQQGFEGTEAEWLESLKAKDPTDRVTSLDDTPLDAHVINARGGLVYVKEENIEQYAHFNITQTGWYVFARIAAETGTVLENVTVTGAAGYIVNDGYVDVAVRFVVAAVSQAVTIAWNAETTEVFVFAAVDRAIDSLDYRVTFYVYDIADYTKWEYALTTDATFAADKYYYSEENGVYTLAEVPAGETVPSYYIMEEETYKQATGTFEDGVTYYTKSGSEYTAAEVTVGDPIPAYYVHSKVTFEGMIRNITYVCNTPIDCPTVYKLPAISDETHGCWYEIRFLHTGNFSSTLEVPEGVKVATEHTQAETKGINMVNLHYTAIGGTKVWRFMNTHSTIPA